MAVVARLAGLLMPALSGAKEKGRLTVCRDNLRQIGLGMLTYTGDNQDYLPWPTCFWHAPECS